MNRTVIIKEDNIADIQNSIARLCKSIKSIQRYAKTDFGIVKKVLDQVKNSKEHSREGSSLQDTFSNLIVDLQYIDVLNQRLDHTCNNITKLSDMLSADKGPDSSMTGYWHLIKLSELQFVGAIRQYVASTEHIQKRLNAVINQYKHVLPKVSDARYLYDNNSTIRTAATQICTHHFIKLLKYRNSTFDSFKCTQELKNICKSYSMKEERSIFTNFLKEEMGNHHGVYEDTDNEEVTLF